MAADQKNEETSMTQPSTWRQVLAAFCVYWFSLSLGASSGFSAVAIPQLQEGVGGFTMSENDISWFASLQTFAMIPTCVLGGVLGQYLGCRLALMFVAPVFTAGFACQAGAGDSAMLMFGRFLAGAAAGLACGPTATYVSEVSTPALRTSLNSGISGAYNLGMVAVFTMGAFCHWRVLAAVSAAFPLLGMACLTIAPESPAWLAARKRNWEARRALERLRGPGYDVSEELDILKKSCEAAERRQKALTSEKGRQNCLLAVWSKIVLFRRRDVYLPFALFLAIAFLQQFSGMSSISYYAINVLVEAGSSVNEYLATILFGLVRFGSQILGSFLLLRFRRRLLLVCSALLVSLGMALLGASAFCSQRDGVGEDNGGALGVLPLVAVILVAFSYHIGLGPIPWSFTAELFPVDVRPFMSGVTNCVSSTYIFIVIKTYPALKEALTMAGAYWFYAGSALLTVAFTLLCIPETKDKRLDQITEDFASKKSRRVLSAEEPLKVDDDQEEN